MNLARLRYILVLTGMFCGVVGCTPRGGDWSALASEALHHKAQSVARMRLAGTTVWRGGVSDVGAAGAKDICGDTFSGDERGEGGLTPIPASWAGTTGWDHFNLLNSLDNGADEGATDDVKELDRGPLPGFWETVKRDFELMPRSMWEDTKAVYTNPTNLVVLLSAGAASLAVRPGVDDQFEDSLREKDIFKEDWSDAFGALGNPGMHFAAAGLWYLVGQQAQDVKTYEVGRTLFNALAINGASTMLLKLATLTNVPNGEPLGWPSGHTSSSVVLAVVMNEAYGPLVGIPLFGLAGLVAVERMDDGEHHFSDIVFGAALGYVVGHTVAKKHRPQIFGGDIVPYADPVSGSSGIAWVKSF